MLKRNAQWLKLAGVGTTAAILAVAGVVRLDAKRKSEVRADIERLCTAEATAKATIEKERTTVETSVQPAIRTTEVHAILTRLKGAAPGAAAADLRSVTREARVEPCPAADGYAALARRLERQQVFDRMCREIDPRNLAKTPNDKRVDVIVDWLSKNGKDTGADREIAPLRGQSPAGATATLRPLLASYDIHVCTMLLGLAAKTDPQIGPNVVVSGVKLDDARERELDAAVRARIEPLRHCYSTGLAKDARLAGKLDVTFHVSPLGQIDHLQRFEGSTFTSPDADACIFSELKKVTLQRGEAAANGTISFELFVVH